MNLRYYCEQPTLYVIDLADGSLICKNIEVGPEDPLGGLSAPQVRTCRWSCLGCYAGDFAGAGYGSSTFLAQ
jgi:hypothetical protein